MLAELALQASMTLGEGRRYMELAPRLALWLGLFLTVTVYCLNMVGDAVRDLLDPRLRGQIGRFGGARHGIGRRGRAESALGSTHRPEDRRMRTVHDDTRDLIIWRRCT